MKIWENLPFPSLQSDDLDGICCCPGPSHPCPSLSPSTGRGARRALGVKVAEWPPESLRSQPAWEAGLRCRWAQLLELSVGR